MTLVDRDLIATALGSGAADLVIRGGRLVNVSTAEIYPADVAIRNTRIAYVGDVAHCIGPDTVELDARGSYLVPGLIEPHLHPESTKLPLTRLSDALLPRGTTTIFAALDETWAVTGIDGVRHVLEQVREAPLRVIYHPYAHVPMTLIEPASTPAHPFRAEDLDQILDWPDTVGTMDTVIDWVLGLDEDILAKMELMQRKNILVHGHDPLEHGPRLQAFLTTGIRSDHVPHSAEEALEKLRAGMWVMFCDGPISHILPDAIRAITETGISSRHATYCIDDLDTRDALETGHLDHQVRTAIACGLNPIEAVQMATINAAECHRLDHLIGSIAPGKYADVVLVPDLRQFHVDTVVASGEVVVRNGELVSEQGASAFPALFYDTFHLARRVTPEDLVLHGSSEDDSARVMVLQVGPENPMRKPWETRLRVMDGVIQSDPEQDVLYCAVVERHKGTGNIGLGFVSGFNLGGGTIVTTLGSPTCNITCLGSNPEDMAFAINYVAEIGGGQVLVKNGEVVAELRLPLGGFMADVPPRQMAEDERHVAQVLADWGCPMERAFIFLMMMEIVPLPHYAITEHGVVDFAGLRYVDPVLPISHGEVDMAGTAGGGLEQ